MPLSPTNSTPLPHCGIFFSVHAAGLFAPWYHVIFTGRHASPRGARNS